MSDRRLDPAQLKARLQASLATEPARGHHRPAVFSQVTEHEALESDHPSVPSENAVADTFSQVLNVSSAIQIRSEGPVKGAIREPIATHRATRDVKESKRRAVVHRCDAGAVLRGYRIPLHLHRRVERAKLEASTTRGATLFWDEVLQGAIDALPTDVREIARSFGTPSGRAEAKPTTRVLQATIRHDQELTLRRLRLDLEEVLDRTVRLEEIWALLVERVVERGSLSA